MELNQELPVLYYKTKVMLEELKYTVAIKSINHQNYREVFNSEKCLCNKFLNPGKQHLALYLRDAGRHHYDEGLVSYQDFNLLRTDITFQWLPSFR